MTPARRGSAGSPFDIAVVGGRCGGASVATWLARAGVSVCVLERRAVLGAVPSTHLLQSSGVDLLADLGLADVPAAVGAPELQRAVLHVDGVEARADLTSDGASGPVAVRRHLLDPPMLQTAEDAGATVLRGAKVEGLLWSCGRVAGVRTRTGSRPAVIHSRLVVGADGVSSTVAALVGAARYNVVANERFVVWGYYRLAGPVSPVVSLWRRGTELVFGYPCDSGLYVVVVQPPRAALDRFRAAPREWFETLIRSHPAFGDIVRCGQLTGRLWVSERHESYFRVAAGPGWALVGDAGHFKDPAMAQGMSDALRQGHRLVTAYLAGPPADDAVDRRTRSWARWRDRDAYGMYWMAVDAASGGSYTALDRATLACVAQSPDLSRRLLRDVWTRHQPRRGVVGPRVVARAALRMAREPDGLARLPVAVARRASSEARRGLRFAWRRYESPGSRRAGGSGR